MIIDDRAGSKELARLRPLADICCLSRLDSGDIQIVGNGPDGTLSVGIEYKSVHDLVSSLATGRLTGSGGQIERMLADYDLVWLLTYGGYRAGAGNRLDIQSGSGGRWRPHRVGSRQVPFGYIESALLSMTMVGVHHKHVASPHEAAEWLAVVERSLSKPWDKHKLFRKFNKAGGGPATPAVDSHTLTAMKAASALPGIGWEKAFAAAHMFESIEAMFCGDERTLVARWMAVDGVGKVLAQSAVSAIKRRRNNG